MVPEKKEKVKALGVGCVVKVNKTNLKIVFLFYPRFGRNDLVNPKWLEHETLTQVRDMQN